MSTTVGGITFSRGVGGAVISPVISPLEGDGRASTSTLGCSLGVGGAVISPVGCPPAGAGAEGVGGAVISPVGRAEEGSGGSRRPSPDCVDGVGGAAVSPAGVPAGPGTISICWVGRMGPPELLPLSVPIGLHD
jgi:hypothetical protein